jgi:DNA-directed RNA polymerase specialized sigma24 family protein
MKLSEYLQRKHRPLTPAQSQTIRQRVMEGANTKEIAAEIGCVPIQVAAVKANMKRGR